MATRTSRTRRSTALNAPLAEPTRPRAAATKPGKPKTKRRPNPATGNSLPAPRVTPDPADTGNLRAELDALQATMQSQFEQLQAQLALRSAPTTPKPRRTATVSRPPVDEDPMSTSEEETEEPDIATATGVEVVNAALLGVTPGESMSISNLEAALSSTPIDQHVDPKIKKAISSHKYVNFRLLLPGVEDMGEGARFEAGCSPITTMDQWISAFTVYMSIYISTHPSMALPLLKHLDWVRELARRVGVKPALDYDKRVRLARQANPCVPFGIPHHESQIKICPMGGAGQGQNQGQGQAFRSQYPQRGQRQPRSHSTTQSNYQPPTGHCFKFNSRGERCTVPSCQYKHQCATCNGRHPTYNCNTSSNTAPTRSKSSKGKHAHKGRQPDGSAAGVSSQ